MWGERGGVWWVVALEEEGQPFTWDSWDSWDSWRLEAVKKRPTSSHHVGHAAEDVGQRPF